MKMFGPKRSPISVLGAGPHGAQLKSLLESEYDAQLYDDEIPAYQNTSQGINAAPWVIGAAWPNVRELIAAKSARGEYQAAVLGEGLPPGTVIFPGAQIGNDVILQRHVHIEYNAVVSHGCTVGAFSTICPGAVLAGEVTLRNSVFVGANATIIHGGITIGDHAIIGAGAVVIDDVPSGAVVAGVPAKSTHRFPTP